MYIARFSHFISICVDPPFKFGLHLCLSFVSVRLAFVFVLHLCLSYICVGLTFHNRVCLIIKFILRLSLNILLKFIANFIDNLSLMM